MYTLQKAYQDIGRKAKGNIQSEKEEVLIGCVISELVEYYFSKDRFYPIEPEGDQSHAASIEKGWNIPDSMLKPEKLFNDKHDFTTEALQIKIPIKSNPSIHGLQGIFPNIGQENGLRLRDDHIELNIAIKGFNFMHDNAAVGKETARLREIVQSWVNLTNTQINNLNHHLKADIRQCIEERVSTIKANEQRYSELSKIINIPLSRRTDPIEKIRINSAPVVQRIKPTPKSQVEYILDRAKVIDIISVLDNQGRQFEKTPATYRTLDEEDLRNILLVNLNTVFEGKAVGEAFSNNGKTDIYLSIDKGNILVAECKIWSGQRSFEKAIDQLLSYLTWRNSFGIIITFCKQKELTEIIKKASSYTGNHTSFAGNLQEVSPSHFSAKHFLLSDSKKEAELHFVFYDLYAKS
jgi:hypothetical protein